MLNLQICTVIIMTKNAGAGYTFYPLSINRVGFFRSISREKIRLFPSVFMCTYFSF